MEKNDILESLKNQKKEQLKNLEIMHLRKIEALNKQYEMQKRSIKQQYKSRISAIKS